MLGYHASSEMDLISALDNVETMKIMINEFTLLIMCENVSLLFLPYGYGEILANC